MATKVKQTPKVTKKSGAKPKAIGGGRKGVEHVSSHLNPKKPGSGHGKTATHKGSNPMPAIVEYPGERKGRNFGAGVKVVGQRG